MGREFIKNFDIEDSVIEFIEENHHKGISNECIEKITQKSQGYVRNEFSKIVNISILPTKVNIVRPETK